MAEAPAPAVFTIPSHWAFGDALAAGLLARTGGDRLALARTVILLPNNRAVRAIGDAFVRRAGAGLLLPRLAVIGDPEFDERLGALLDPIEDGEAPIPPAIEPMARRMILARLVQEERQRAGDPVDAAEAVRLAADLGRAIDQLLIEDRRAAALSELSVVPELSEHWQRALGLFVAVERRWRDELARAGCIDLADRRGRLLRRAARRWAAVPPPGLVVAAGITTAAPAVARLLRTIAFLERGMVVLPGLDCALDRREWDALGPHEPDPVTGLRPPAIEGHPQFQLKLLLDRMGVARGEVRRWRQAGGPRSSAARGRAVAHAMAPARFTGKWRDLKPRERRLSGIRALEVGTPAEEAQAIAIALRHAIETPGRTAALVTPDRLLATRVSAHLERWAIAADDSAGRPLTVTPPGAFLLALAEVAAQRFAPVPLLALLKHPLVRQGDGRLDWLAQVRRLDRALRGPRPPAGLDGIAACLAGGAGRDAELRRPVPGWWKGVAETLRPLEAAFAGGATLSAIVAALREAAERLAADAVWSGPAGRAAAELVERIEAAAPEGPGAPRAEAVAPLLARLMDDVAVRPPQGGHPRIFIWGLIEARLQQADLVVLGGLNEGSWPALPTPDPWLSPRVRAELGLAGLERRVGLAAHEFVSALGAPQILVTRARRDARAPAVASRLWLRLEAMSGGMTRAPELRRWTQQLDRPAAFAPAGQPAPVPPAEARPKRIAVTKLDRLKADPFAFYADAILKLSAWEAPDAEPGPAWRGTAVHAILEAWAREDGCAPEKLRARAEALLAATAAHPVQRALWQPRLIEAIDWIAERMAALRAEGRAVLTAEVFGEAEVGGITLYGKVDRIDRLPDGRLAIVDYKTGKAPGPREVAAGYAMQLGLLGLIAERGGFKDARGVPAAFEYWSLAADKGQLGHVRSPVGGRGGDAIPPEAFTAHAARVLADAAAKWLTGTAPFTAKLHPEYAPYADYDQLMRLDEWYGRQPQGEARP